MCQMISKNGRFLFKKEPDLGGGLLAHDPPNNKKRSDLWFRGLLVDGMSGGSPRAGGGGDPLGPKKGQICGCGLLADGLFGYSTNAFVS